LTIIPFHQTVCKIGGVYIFNCADVSKQEKQTVFEEGGRTRGLTISVFDGETYVGGWNRAEDFHYERKEVCSLLIAFEPLTGQRLVQVRKQRTMKDYAYFMKELADARYPKVEQIMLVQDNLNTHEPGSF